jgi:hypothetical protein
VADKITDNLALAAGLTTLVGQYANLANTGGASSQTWNAANKEASTIETTLASTERNTVNTAAENAAGRSAQAGTGLLDDAAKGVSSVGDDAARGVDQLDDLSLLDSKAQKHILDGDSITSGGHRAGTGNPGKSEFPASWSDQKIENVISDIATDPKVQWSKPDPRGYITTTATRDGVEVKVVYDTVNKRIVTGYPTNLSKNP